MVLGSKKEPEIIPQYSLTGDLISFLRCGLQYRYYNGSSLPPSRPVQQWFGEFIHGIMENAYRLWSDSAPTFPWPCHPTPYRNPAPPGRLPHDIGTIGDVVEASLRAQGKLSRSSATRLSAYRRAHEAVNQLGPYLFPLIAFAEQKVIGTRTIPNNTGLRSSIYELKGVIDVVTDVELNGAANTNIIKQAIQNACPGLNGRFEVIVDYKGARRPAINHAYWLQGNWQIQTYSWLRTKQPNNLPVAAGVLLYINELSPSGEDLVSLKRDIQLRQTDVFPVSGSRDAYMLNTWQPGNAIPNFSLDFRLQRAIHVIPVNNTSQLDATSQFDRVVEEIEECVSNEAATNNISGNWGACGDEATCVACDFRHFCPDPAPRNGPHVIESPSAP